MKKLFTFCILCFFTAFGFGPAVLAQGDCTITTLPYTEGFELGSIGPCYHTNSMALMPNGQYYPQVAGGAYAPSHTGEKHLMSYNFLFDDTAPQVPCLILPELSSTYNMTDMVFEFWGWVNSDAGYFVVGVMDDPTDMSTFTPVQTIVPTNTNSTYVKYTAYFSNYTGSGHYVALKLAVTAYCMIRVDDLVLDQAAMCSPVQDLAVQEILGSDVTINWHPNAIGAANSYNVSLFSLTDSTQVLYSSTADTFYTFSNLDYSTDYRAYVSVVCIDNQESDLDSVDFSTLAPAATLPYFEDFEGDSSVALEPFTFSGTGVNQWVFGTAAGLPALDALPDDPAHAIYVSPDSGATNIYANSVSDAYATINVMFPNDEMEYHLSFDYRVVGEASDYAEFDYLKVYMINSDATVPSSGAPNGVALLHHLGDVANISDWTHFDIILNNVAGTAKQIVFYWYNNGWNLYGDSHFAAAVDNIRINGVNCAQPNGLYASDITETEATLHWHEVGNATYWTLYYRESGSADPYTEYQTSDTSVTLNGLTANTEYSFYVVSDCGDGLSNPSVTATFRTDCGTIETLPYIEDFESGLYQTSQGTYIACWDRLTSDNNHYAYIGDGDYYAQGGYHYLDFHYTPNCSVIAVMPELGANINANDLMLTFYACHTNLGFYALGNLEVGVMTDKTNDSTFVTLQTINLSMTDYLTYVEHTISLANYDGTGKYIAFRVSNCSNCSYYIDNLILDLRPACMDPTSLTTSSVSNTSVTLSWTEMGGASSWNIQYDTTGFTLGQGANTVVADNTTFTITGLTDLTAYDFYVQANCGDSQSEWIGPVSATTGILIMGVTGSEALTTCNAIICDNGGSTGDYSPYCDYTVVVTPATDGMGLQISGTANLFPSTLGFGESHLYFYEGAGVDGTLLADYTGQNLNIEVASAGTITVRFTSSYYTSSGFVLNVECVTCTPPTDIAVTNLTTDEATLTWSGDASQYAIYLSGNTYGYYTQSDTVLTLNNLQANSQYNVQIRSLCGSDSSFLSQIVSFTTPCDAITITESTPWTEDFESYLGDGNQPFQCWDRPVVDATYNAPFVYCGWAPSCYSGANSAELKGTSEILVLPAFTNNVHDLRLSFWATATNPAMGMLEIGVVDNTLDPASFEFVAMAGTPGPRGTQDGVSGNGNYMGPFDFNNVAAANGRIALRYNSSSSSDSWNLDNFVVEIATDTTAVTDPTVLTNTPSFIGQTSATLSATVTNPDNVTVTAKGFEWKTATGSTYTQIAGTGTGNTFTANLTNLTPNTSYTYKAFITFDGNTVYGNEVTFTTLPEDTPEPCETPTNLHASAFDAHSITIGWNANSNASGWNIRYRVENGSWSNATSTTNTYVMSGLVAETVYEIEVQADCGDGNLSDWCEPIHISTSYDGIDSWLSSSVSLYPNPAREVVNVQCTMNNVQMAGELHLFDVYGKLLQIVPITSEITPINVSGLANGLYFVRVTTEEGSVTKTFVKKG